MVNYRMTTDPTQALVRLQELSFQGAGTYLEDSGVLPLANQGLVLIAGQEGAGKSMVLEVPTLVLFGKGAPRVRSKSLAESSIINTATGYRGTLRFDSGYGASAQQVEIVQAHKYGPRKANKYAIAIDGVQQDIDGKPAQKKFVKRLCPLSYEEWMGVVYLHQGGIHDLLAGTPKEKKEYLTSVFGLDFYDDLVFVTAEELKDLKKTAEGSVALEQSLLDLKESIKEQNEVLVQVPGGIEEVEAGIKKLSKRMQSISAKLGNLEAQRKTAKTYAAVIAQIAASDGPDGKVKTDKLLKKCQQIESETLQKVTEDRTLLKGIEAQQRTYDRALNASEKAAATAAKCDKRESSAAKKINGLPPVAVLAALSSAIVKLSSRMGSDTSIDPEAAAEDANWIEMHKEVDVSLTTAKKLTKLMAKDHTHCPTCDHPLSADEMRSTISALKEKADTLYERIVSAITFDLLEITDWWAAGGSIDLGDLSEKCEDALECHVEFDTTAAAHLDAVESASEALDALGEVDKPSSQEDLVESISEAEEALEALEEQTGDLEQRMKLYERADALAEAAEGIDLEALTEEAEELNEKKSSVTSKHVKASALKAEYDQASGALVELTRQVKQVEKKLDEHADNALQIKHYEETLVPYFNALRAGKVHSCASVLEGVLPVYVGAMATDQYAGAEVRLKLSDDLKQMDLLLRTGKDAPWLSAVQASGGQRRRFTLAIIAALREVTPRRANVMFFDEPFADLQAEGKLLFINKLAPTLLDRCEDLESIFIVAHDREVLDSSNDTFDSVWVAKRDEKGSRLLLDQKLSQVAGQ